MIRETGKKEKIIFLLILFKSFVHRGLAETVNSDRKVCNSYKLIQLCAVLIGAHVHANTYLSHKSIPTVCFMDQYDVKRGGCPKYGLVVPWQIKQIKVMDLIPRRLK